MDYLYTITIMTGILAYGYIMYRLGVQEGNRAAHEWYSTVPEENFDDFVGDMPEVPAMLKRQAS